MITLRSRRALCSLLSGTSLCFAATVVLPTSAAYAQARTGGISIPAQDLSKALDQVAATTGVKVTYDPDAVRGLTSVRVNRANTALEAVVKALSGNPPLAVRTEQDGTLAVFRAESANAGDIVVTARRDEAETNYRVNKATTSDRSGGTLRDLPQNTAVISDRLIRDQQVQTIDESIRNVAGATVNANSGQGLSSFNVRGFNVAPVTNGTGQTANAAASGASTQPVSNVERIEVLKGPAAILAGQRNLGGTINIVTKKPTADPLLNVTAEYQSFGSVRGIIDASQAITANRLFSARVIMEKQDARRNYGGYEGREVELLAPSIRFKDNSTDIIASASINQSRQPSTAYTAFNTIANSPVPVGSLVDRPDRAPIGRLSAGVEIDSKRYGIDATKTLASWLTIAARGEHYNQTLGFTPVSPLAAGPTYGTLLVSNDRAEDRSKGNSVDTFARLKFETFGLRHTLVGGFNYTDLFIRHYDALGGAPITINLLDPNVRIPEPDQVSGTVSYTINYHEKGVYTQDLIEYGPVHLSVGYRYNWYHALTVVTRRNRITDQRAESGVPAFGLVVDLNHSISLYGNYTKGYIPTTALAFDGSVLPDVRSSNKEVGLKADLFNNGASLVVSLFDNEQDNRIITDTAHPGFSTSVAGGQRARGVDATLTGRITRSVNLNATYAYTKYDFANPTAATAAGLIAVDGQPRHSYSVFASYTHPSNFIGGALGVFGRSEAPVTYTTFPAPAFNRVQTIFYVPGGAQIDGNIYINPTNRLRLNLGLKNIFDKRLYSSSTAINLVPVVDGRTFTATLSYRFFN